MQHKKSKHNGTLKIFRNINTFEECFMNILKILTRHKLGGKIVLKCKGNKAYPKAKERHGLLLTKLPPNS
jgi:hypothetical protein